ncbi:MAG: DUF4956 domain-containing protein [Bacteroidota bacterium]
MTNIKMIFLFLLLLCPGTSTIQSKAQFGIPSDQTTTTQVDENNEKEKKSEKKKEKEKDKEKDTVEINANFFLYLGMNLLTLALIISLVYYPRNRQYESIFTFLMFNIMIFMLTFVLNKIKISVGAAFGLFAVFSMLRYRTEGISMKDMTYLFIFIAIGLISAIQLDFEELAIINGIILVITFLLDSNLILKRESSKMIRYENIDLVKPENSADLLEDLRQRTGLKIHRHQIVSMNFQNDTAEIKIYYYENKK